MIKILYLPENTASVPAITTQAINKIKGVKAVCITSNMNPLNSLNVNTLFIPKTYSKKFFLKWLFYKLTYKRKIKRWIKWADVVHYTWGPAFENGKDLRFAVKNKKPVFIEWLGSDIRDVKYLSSINKYYKEAFNNGYEYRQLESSDYSIKVQKLFSSAGAKPLLNPEMSLYLNRDFFPKGSILIMPRLNVSDFTPKYPNAENKRLLIIHSPTARVSKGTSFILEAIKDLKEKYDFDFRLVEKLPRTEALRLMSDCDIFIDQLIIGAYGLSSVEAMSFGKPVLCNILPEVNKAGLPSECPVVNANPETIKEQLVMLLTNPTLRNELGKKGREYVERYHDADKLAKELVKLYQSGMKQ